MNTSINFPLHAYGYISDAMNLWWALLIGVAFGFVLERGGLGHAKKLVGQFLLKDFMVFKVMFTAIITAMLGLFYLSYFGVMNLDLVVFPDNYLVAQLIGGLILGTGFAMAGYCPGTTIVGMATGKIDALICFVALFLGTWVFMLAYDHVKGIYQLSQLTSEKLHELWSFEYGTVSAIVVIVALLIFYILEKSTTKL